MSDDRALLAAALPRYAIGEELGRGGWGVVYRGQHRDLGRPVAIKQLLQTATDHAARERFVSEARLVASLEHPHLVPVYDYVEHEGICAIVMELASGGALSDRMADGLSDGQAIAAVLAVAIGLDHAHGRQLLHRDIKPDNVLFTAGTVKLTDFGIAKVLGADGSGPTATGTIIGTPAYMAPEQVSGGVLSPATDIYSLAVLTYQLLARSLPYPDVTDQAARLFQHVHDEPRPLTSMRGDVPPAVANVVHRALAKEPSARQASAEQFAVELAEATADWFGSGWLSPTGIAVMGSNAVITGAENGSGLSSRQGPPSAETVIDRTPSSPSSTSSAPTVASPAVAEPTSGLAQPGSRKLPLLVAIAAVAVAILGGGAAFLALGDDDGPGALEQPTTVTQETLSSEEIELFLQTCADGGVPSELCSCVAVDAEQELPPEVFRRGLDVMMTNDGDLIDEFTNLFAGCQGDGS